jgi:hypothetical protein
MPGDYSLSDVLERLYENQQALQAGQKRSLDIYYKGLKLRVMPATAEFQGANKNMVLITILGKSTSCASYGGVLHPCSIQHH